MNSTVSSSTMALSVKEAAHEVGACRDSIYSWIRSGELRALKMGRRTIILRSDLENFVSRLPQLELSPDAEQRKA